MAAGKARQQSFQAEFSSSNQGPVGYVWWRTFRVEILQSTLGLVERRGNHIFSQSLCELFWGRWGGVVAGFLVVFFQSSVTPVGGRGGKFFGRILCKVFWGQWGVVAANFSGGLSAKCSLANRVHSRSLMIVKSSILLFA